MTTLFDKNVESSETDNDELEVQSYAELLVGEGKKFKDLESLARGKHEADQFIARLLKEQNELRKDMEARLSLEELVSKIGSNTSGGANSQQPQSASEGRNNENSDNSHTKTVDINELVEAAIGRKQTELARQANLATVEAELKATWGSDYANKLRKAVETLGVSPDFIDDVAAKAPKAAVALLLGGEPSKSKGTVNAAPVRSSVNTQGMASASNDASRSKEYYSKLRKENPKAYWSPKVQMEIHELALAGKLQLD